MREIVFTIKNPLPNGGTLITVWYECGGRYNQGWAWKFKLWKWRLQIHPYEHLRRRYLTRCEWCDGRHHPSDPVDCGSPGRSRARWWQGEQGLFHRDCYEVHLAYQICTCVVATLAPGGGRCLACGRFPLSPYARDRGKALARYRFLQGVGRGVRP